MALADRRTATGRPVQCREVLGGTIHNYYWPDSRAAYCDDHTWISSCTTQPEGVHLLLQVRTDVLNEDWEETFRTWYPQFRPVAAYGGRIAGQPDAPRLFSALSLETRHMRAGAAHWQPQPECCLRVRTPQARSQTDRLWLRRLERR